MPPRIDISPRSLDSAKADPYATKTHRRIDVALLVLTVLLMLNLASVAHGQTATTSTLSPTATGNGFGKGGKPKPTPTPSPAPGIDGESDWNNAGTTWSTPGNWTGVGGGTAPPSSSDVAWFK